MTEINYDQVSEKVSEEKYYLKNEINDFKKMAKRIGTFIGAAEKNPFLMKLWSEKFVQLISEKRFIPGGRILANAGTYFEDLSFDQRLFLKEMIDNYDKSELRCGQMLNCYVIPIEDSKHGPASIYQSLEDAADITAMEGGVGENFSNLRPEGFMIRGNPKYRASGPVSFLKLYNASSVELKQGGGRRGANMAVLNVDHPDIMKFINCKRVEGTIENFNISVGITDDFMEAVVDDKDFNLMWDGKIIQTVKARTIFNEICSGIYNDGGGGEPGFLFLDTAMKTWPFPHEKPQTTNPCGEQFLGYYEACDLGAMNLFWYVTEDGYFDDDKFKEDIKTAIRFLDNVLDLNNYPLKYRDDICEKISMNHRRIGLGIMGLADTLVALGLGYGSEEANIFIEDKMRLFDQVAHDASVELGKEKGLFLSHDEALPKFSNRRNCCVTTIAPTGTTSMIADVWGGCEPWFGIVTKKKTTDGSNNVYYMVPKAFRLLCKKHGFDLTDSVLEKIYENKGSVQGLDFIPKEIRESAITAMDITWREHVSIQCTLQKYIENSISKTINLPRKSSIEDVKEAIFALWRGGAKGGTIYRDGTRNLQIMNVGGSENKSQVEKQDKLPVRPDVLSGKTHKVVTNLTHKPENIYITINENDNGHPVELFVHNTDDNNITTFIEFLIHNQVKPDIAQMIAGKISQMSKENISVTTRLVSLCLRHDLPIESIIKQLRRINQHDLYNLHKKISKLLAGYISNNNTVIDSCNNIVDGKICGGRLMFQESCLICDTCFVSKCD